MCRLQKLPFSNLLISRWLQTRQNKTVFSMDKSRLCFERKPFSLSTKAVFARDFLRFSFGHDAKVKIILSVVASFVAHWGLLGTFGYNRVQSGTFGLFCVFLFAKRCNSLNVKRFAQLFNHSFYFYGCVVVSLFFCDIPQPRVVKQP